MTISIIGLAQLKQVNDIRKKLQESKLGKLNLKKNKLINLIQVKDKIEEQIRLKHDQYKKSAFKELINQNITENHIYKIERHLQSLNNQIEMVVDEKEQLIEQLNILEKDIAKVQALLKKLNIRQEKYQMLTIEELQKITYNY